MDESIDDKECILSNICENNPVTLISIVHELFVHHRAVFVSCTKASFSSVDRHNSIKLCMKHALAVCYRLKLNRFE